jgi:hypothetical protein
MSIPKEAVSLDYALSHLTNGDFNYWAVDANGELYLFNSQPVLDAALKIWKPTDSPDFPMRCARIDMSEYNPVGWMRLHGEFT